ncbi:MAG: hypothetical protein JSR97_07230 [Verrucomicrobia bacterium]|nr:hypothetical protein [Verrucomicrobiota bacterium]
MYVNPEEPISPSWSDNSFYPVYSYQPETVLKEAAYASISHITATRSMRKEDILAYNQHGTALFFRGKDQYTLYWAQPDESMANPIALLPKVSFLRSSKAAAFSQDGRVGLILDETGICYLNGEVATRLVTNTADTQDF